MARSSISPDASLAQLRQRDVTAPAALDSKRIGELDGLRAIAIGLVLIYHAIGDTPGLNALRALPGRLSLVWIPVAHTWLGVDLFFVLSGFLITGLLFDSRRKPRYYRNFYLRRAARILPVLLVVLAAIAIFTHGPLPYFILALFFCANLADLLGIDIPVAAAPLWSIAVEEQFYLLWPTFVRRLPMGALFWLAGAICLIEPCVRALTPGLDTAIHLTWLRSDGLAFGALVALWIRCPQAKGGRLVLPALGALILAATVFVFESQSGVASLGAALRVSEADLVFAAAVLAAYAWRGSPATGFLRSGLATFVAGTSYCAYLIHAGIFNAVDAWGWTGAPGTLEAGLMRLFCGIPLVFGIAAISKHFLEDPFLRLRTALVTRSTE